MLDFIKNIFSSYKVVNAKDRIDRIYFSNYSDYETHKYGTFTCSNCKTELVFERKNFAKHMASNFTNLNSFDAKQIGSILKRSQKNEINSFLDFYCPQCKFPVRIYYMAGIGGKHCEEAYIVKYVVEKKQSK